MELRILGPLELAAGDRLVAPGGAKQRALLCVLALHLNEVVTSERLIEDIWGEAAPATAAKSVQVYVSGLRRALQEAGAEGVLVTRPGGYALELDPDRVDARRFERLLAEGQRTDDPARSAELLRRALGLWRGAALVDFSYLGFAQSEIARLEELRATALEARIDADLRLGRHAALVGELEGLVTADPARERLAGQLMEALYHSGRQAEALEVYQRIRRHLDTELGLEPGPQLKALQAAVLAQSLSPPARPREPEPEPAKPSVPAPPTPTVGREHELERLRAALADPATRLVTIVGPGGMGKTRMAIEVGQRRAGAVFVALASLAESDHVPAAIAAALELTSAPGVDLEDQLARRLGSGETLLILDNFEHVLDAAPLVADLLARAPGLKVVATSREPLRIRAERVFPLPPLDDAVELFLQVARARDPGYAPDAGDLAAIAALCRRLDGLPLAIELAAGRVGLLTPRELAQRLDEGIDVLAHGPRDAPARHRALRATLTWSHELLDASEQTAFAKLGVFAGGSDVATARAVTGVSLDVLETLRDKQLIVEASGRIGMLETIRSFAVEQLAARTDAERICRRHAEHYLALIETTAVELRRTASLERMERLEPEVDNVRAALSWALEAPDPELALRLATAFDEYLTRRRPTEGEHWIGAALAIADHRVPPHVRVAALHRRAYQLNFNAAWTRAAATAREGLAIAETLDDARWRAQSLIDLAYSVMGRYQHAEATAVADEAVAWARRAGDDTTLAEALTIKVAAAFTLADAIDAAAEAEALYTRTGNAWQLIGLANKIAHRALCDGDYRAAEQAVSRARGAAQAAGAQADLQLPYLDGTAGLLATFQCDYAQAARAFGDVLRRARDHAMGGCIYEGLVGIAALLGATGEVVASARLRGAADAFLADPRNGVMELEDTIAQRLELIFDETRNHAGADLWEGARAVGAGLTGDEAVELALAHVAHDRNAAATV